MFTRKSLLFGLAGLVLCATFAIAQEGTRTGQRGGHRGPFAERRADRLERFERRAEIRKFVRKLEIDDVQRAQALAAAKAIAPIAKSVRAEARTILENARKANPTGDRAAIREATRESLKALRARAEGQIVPIARGVFDTLTLDQKDKLRAAAERHGRTFDAERATRRIGFLLARPRAVEFLEARTQR